MLYVIVSKRRQVHAPSRWSRDCYGPFPSLWAAEDYASRWRDLWRDHEPTATVQTLYEPHAAVAEWNREPLAPRLDFVNCRGE
jgi:hypothetical protein